VRLMMCWAMFALCPAALVTKPQDTPMLSAVTSLSPVMTQTLMPASRREQMVRGTPS